MIPIIVTLLMLAVLILGIIKKANIQMLLLSVGVITLLGYTLVTGNSVAAAPSGSLFWDVFELVKEQAVSNLSGVGLIVMSVMGYVAYMNYMKASQLFAYVVSKPLKKIKQPYLIASITIIVGAFIKLVIPAGSSMTALTLATIYPVLLACGVTTATAASALIMATVLVWGPGEGLIYWIFDIVGISDLPVAEYFVKYQVPIAAAMLAVMAVTFYFSSKYFDKKENAKAEKVEGDADIDPKSLGVPMYYAVLPILPLFFVLIFSELIMGSVVISIVAANFCSFFVSVIINMLVKKQFTSVFDETKVFFEGIGTSVPSLVFYMIAGQVFAAAMDKIGGMSILANLMVNAGGSWVTLTVIGCCIYTLMIACTGALEGSIYLFAPLFMKIAAATGGNLVVMMACMIMCSGIGFSLCPVSTPVIMASTQTNVSMMTIAKRNIPPCLAGMAVMFILTIILFV